MNPQEKNKIINDVLSQRHYKNSMLPTIGENESWWAETLKRKLEEINKWISSLFSQKSDAWKFPSFAELLSILEVVIIISLVLVLIYTCYQVFLWHTGKKKPVFTSSSLTPVTVVAEDPDSRMSLLLGLGKYSEALRLRWRIFLKNMGINMSRTPTDLNEVGGIAIQINDHLFGDLNQMMFGPFPPTREETEKCIDTFMLIEKNQSRFESE